MIRNCGKKTTQIFGSLITKEDRMVVSFWKKTFFKLNQKFSTKNEEGFNTLYRPIITFQKCRQITPRKKHPFFCNVS